MIVQIIAAWVVIIAIFVIVIGFFVDPIKDPNLFRYWSGTLDVESIARAVERFRADCGRYPSATEGLGGLVVNPGIEGWQGPYVEQPLFDPWQRPYIYSLAGGVPEIVSLGADGKIGGESYDGDISSRRPRHAIAESPFEARIRRNMVGTWIGAWLCLVGSIVVLRKASRR